MASQYPSFAGSLPKWDCDVRPGLQSSMSSDLSYLEDQHPASGGSGGSAAARTAAGHPRRRIGRPIAYTGDPDAQHLTETERRRIKRLVPASSGRMSIVSASIRRIANRESARRVRRKRQNALEDMQEKLEQVHEHVLMLTARLQQAERERAYLVWQLCEVHESAGEAGEATAAGVAQQGAEEAERASTFATAATGTAIKLEPGCSIADAVLLPRSHVSHGSAMGGGGGAVTTGGRGMDGLGHWAGPAPQGGGMSWSGGGAADLSRPMQPMFVAVTPTTSHTRLQFSTGRPASTPASPQVQPPPPPLLLPGNPLLDVQSMSSADDPLDCFMGSKPSRVKEDAATPLGLEWRY